MARVPASYVSGMKAFSAFFEMLYDCLQELLPTAVLSKSGAYVWRGYRIDAYETLAKCHYYFLVYCGDPKHLILEEAYWDSRHRYCRPFMLRLNLQDSRLFLLDMAEQRAFLSEFIRRAAQQALIWQESSGRATVVTPDRLEGREIASNPRSEPPEPRQIGEDYLVSTPLQNRLFGMLKDAVSDAAADLPGLSHGVDFKFNASWYNWDFRGQAMKAFASDGFLPEGPYPFRWNIYYDTPAVITLESYDGKRTERIDHLDLQNSGFFDLEEAEQREALKRFALRALGAS
jgi:hypothetical protein